MPTMIRSISIKTRADVRRDLMPLLVIVALSLLFALAFCSAFAPRPVEDATVAALRGGL